MVTQTKRLSPPAGPSTVGGRIDPATAQPLLKKLKVEGEDNRPGSTGSTKTASTVSTSLTTSSNPDINKTSTLQPLQQSFTLPQSCEMTAKQNQSEAPLTSATGTNMEGVNGTRVPNHSSICNSDQGATPQNHSQTKTIITPAIATETGLPTVTLTSTEGAMQGRLSSDICNSRDRSESESASVSTLSSNESSGKKEFGSPLSSSPPSPAATPKPNGVACGSHVSINATMPIVPRAENPVISGTSSSQNSELLGLALPPQTSSMGQKAISNLPPLKSTKMVHLRIKYLLQLEYMHREFKKLERQLLGAKSSSKNITESAGSKERREKLHSFIVHLEETMNQIQVGCELENEGKSTLGVAVTSSGGGMIDGGSVAMSKPSSANSSVQSATSSSLTSKTDIANEEMAKREFARSSALTKVTKEKEEEENVQKLEEHILANLLPVKERLTKQLAAQQGAAKNPVGMPTRRGLQPPGVAPHGRAMATNTQNFPSGEHGPLNPQSTGPIAGPTAHSQFGQPLKGGGSSLTQKLHGKTLGSQQRSNGHGVGTGVGGDGINVQVQVPEPITTTPRKVIYAGMTPGSRQVRSGVSAASGVHDMVIGSARHKIESDIDTLPQQPSVPPPPPSPSGPINAPSVKPKIIGHSGATTPAVATSIYPGGRHANKEKSRIVPLSTSSYSPPLVKELDLIQKKRQKVDKRRVDQDRQRLLMQQQQLLRQQTATASRRVVASTPGIIRSISNQRKGPRTVEYVCALCNETYKSACEYNPWWALSSHECAKCGKTQIPRLDISAPANIIEYHPALLAHVTTDDPKGACKAVSLLCHPASQGICGQGVRKAGAFTHRTGDKVGFESDSEDSGYDENTPSARAENEDFGKNYSGPKFTEYDASRLLSLISHASTCPGHHKNQNVSNSCTNVKYMMLHVRDCPGTTPSYDICPYPWCRKTKHLLYHLVSCDSPTSCKICSPTEISENLRALQGLNRHRAKVRLELVATHFSSQHAPTKAVNSTEGGLVSDVGKKSVQQKKLPSNDTMNSEIRINRTLKPTERTKHPALVSHTGSIKRCKLTVPSPISTVNLPSNSLVAIQTQATSLKNHLYPATRPSSDPSVPISTATTSSTSVDGTNALHSTSVYATQKTFSPPNPLKGLSSDQSAMSTSFPTLINHISVNRQVKMKVEGIQ